ncbi:MAG: MoaD/ThiS family protein [Saprospiraceae bacterium]|nr:MoaD/ThiS family protein [Saprospiraceae bacterium]
MKTIINEEPYYYREGTSLIQVLEDLDLDVEKVNMILVNNEITAKDIWETYLLEENDQILIIAGDRMFLLACL